MLFIEAWNEIDDQQDSPSASIRNIVINTTVQTQVGTEVKEVARHVSDIYVGATTEIPIYDFVETSVLLNNDNIASYFKLNAECDPPDVDEWDTFMTYQEDINGFRGISSYGGPAVWAIRAVSEIRFVSFDYSVQLPSKVLIYDTCGNIYIDEIVESSGSIQCTLPIGECLVAKLDIAEIGSDGFYCTINNVQIHQLTNMKVGTKIEDNIARKVTKVYLGENGVAQLCYFIPTYLKDFEYKNNYDGTYTLTAWKGTKNGEPSTELIIPNDRSVIL